MMSQKIRSKSSSFTSLLPHFPKRKTSGGNEGAEGTGSFMVPAQTRIVWKGKSLEM
jgi:hypothetical protein